MKGLVLVMLGLGFLGLATGCRKPADPQPEGKPAESASESQAERQSRLSLQASEWTAEAFAALSGRLTEVMEAEGPAAAIKVCSEEALPLVREVSERHGVEIRRVSDRPRNPANRADAADLAAMEIFRTGHASPQVETRTEDDVVIVRMPIRIPAPLCLQCHGDPAREVAESTLAALRERYPEDAATGYREGDLRGLWRVEIPAVKP
jgi:hypothetical protein